MKKTPAKKVADAGKQLVRKGKALRGKAGATARGLKKTVADAVSTSSRRLKKGIKTAKSSPASRQARKVGEVVGTFNELVQWDVSGRLVREVFGDDVPPRTT